jgi:hypothetical protein
MSDKNFEWLKKWEFSPEIVKDFDIDTFRKAIAPKATENDWNFIRACLNSKGAIFEKDKIGIPFEMAKNIAGNIRSLTKIIENFVFDLVQKNGKSYYGDEVKQYILISTPLCMFAFDDFSPLETAKGFYEILHNILDTYSDRQTVSETEFNDVTRGIQQFAVPRMRETVIRYLTIAGLLEERIGKDRSVSFQLDPSPGRIYFEEWINQFFQYRFQIRNPKVNSNPAYDSDSVDDEVVKRSRIPLNRLSLSVLNVLGLAETLRKETGNGNHKISTRLLFSAALISAEQNSQKNSARAILDYLIEDHKDKSGVETNMPAPDLVQLASHYGIKHRRFKPSPIDETDIGKLSRGAKLALDIALNEYSGPTLNESKIELRHLLAALLFANKSEHRMGIQKFIYGELGIHIDALKNIFMEYVGTAHSSEFDSWGEILEATGNEKTTTVIKESLNKKEIVPIHHDDPTSDDKLQRRALAEVLYKRIKEIRRNQKSEIKESFWTWFKSIFENNGRTSVKKGSFLIHLSGAWGSGKTNFISYLYDCMKLDERQNSWIVVDFNAWQHQRLSPPWWFLINSFFTASLRQIFKLKNPITWIKCIRIIFLESVWRLSLNLTSAIGLAIFYVFLVCFSPSSSFESELQKLFIVFFKNSDDQTENIDVGIRVILAFCGLVFAWTKILTPISSKAADQFIKSTSDPLKKLKEHFSDTVKRINRPICVLIDDLDRCQAKYVVELLEGIQTLFQENNVIYIVIAERNWLSVSYAKIYEDFGEVNHSPGKPIGYFYLDKIFQLSFSLPPIGANIKNKYWKTLINSSETKEELRNKLDAFNESAEKVFREMPEKADIVDELKKRIDDVDINQTSDSEFMKQALKRAAVLKFNELDSIANEMHVLEEFSPLLEPNPRSMKRLVNEYSVDRSIDILYDGNIDRNKLAKWAILKLRWPLLAEYLLNHPSDIKLVETDVSKNRKIPKGLRSLFNDEQVVNVVKDKVVSGILDEQMIKQLNYSDVN